MSLLGRQGPRRLHPCPAAVEGEGLLHDARNLMGALGLYCDLLSMPGVLKREHRHYPEELRLLGTRSGTLIERLMQSLHAQGGADGLCLGAASHRVDTDASAWAAGRTHGVEPVGEDVRPVSLRTIVERCSGLLSRVAGGRPIEVSYGDGAAVPVRVAEEAVERILVNLVRNAAAALGEFAPCHDPARAVARSAPAGGGLRSSVKERTVDPTCDETPGAIRIGVGSLINRVGDPRPWPFRRVRLVVEDSGCGMAQEQLERLLCGGRTASRGNHGIGFRVVQEMVAASNGDLRAMSAPDIGTRVQIEWPMAALSSMESGLEPGEASIADLRPGQSDHQRPDALQLRTESRDGVEAPLPSPPNVVDICARSSSGRRGDFRTDAGSLVSC